MGGGTVGLSCLDTYHFTCCSTVARLRVDQIKVFPMLTITQVVEEYDRLYKCRAIGVQIRISVILDVCLWPITRPSA